ncbi:hypothetical protein M231_00745 [Tremella mesenterica]|uniref:Uncharacterized protein n=1 Tax=Tremella mesenterica TaxID=5217 RepID=A0A4Q1BV52_TREME|nr:hypothetical protein M231_00745 [Tremella mesenterica]
MTREERLTEIRFKRVGPNAMRGRGIGAARGRATIQRANARRGTTRTNQGVRR